MTFLCLLVRAGLVIFALFIGKSIHFHDYRIFFCNFRKKVIFWGRRIQLPKIMKKSTTQSVVLIRQKISDILIILTFSGPLVCKVVKFKQFHIILRDFVVLEGVAKVTPVVEGVSG